MGFRKNDFITFCSKYQLNEYFAFGIFNARLEPILTKILSKSFHDRLLFVIVTPEFCEVLPFSFKVTVDLIPSQVFLKFVEYF